MSEFKYQEVLEMLENDQDATNRLLRLFIEQSSNDFQILQNAFDQKDLVMVSKTAHKLKSSLLLLGLSDASELFKKIEFGGKNQIEINQLSELINDAHRSLLEVNKQIESALSNG